MFDGNFRRGVDKVLDPVGVALSRIGITANALTAAGIVIASVGAIFIWTRSFVPWICLSYSDRVARCS